MGEYVAEITCHVTQGDQRGRAIGFPTANLLPGAADAVPPAGVYAALADGRPAAVNIGTRPTFAGATPGLVVEVHILDFSGDLYGHSLTVQFVERLREERRFDSVEALLAQLRLDIAAVRKALGAS
jgi:riboflavin kinase / FMN adenylyltransferase